MYYHPIILAYETAWQEIVIIIISMGIKMISIGQFYSIALVESRLAPQTYTTEKSQTEKLGHKKTLKSQASCEL